MAYADKERLTSLAQGIRDRLLIKDKTEAQALVLSVTYPNCIYYTSDTHCIIVAGHVYGRSNQVSADAPFAYLPADVSSPSADPQFDSNHDTIYIQPIKTGADAGKIKLWWYVNNTWVSTDTLDLVLPTDAEDITYDLTNTPDLGSGDVQSAIEALDGKVEELRDEVLGDEWVEEIFGRKADWIRTNCYQGNIGGWAYSGNSKCYGFKVNAGDTFHFIDPQHNHLHMWNAYADYQDMSGSGAYSGTRPDLVEEECDPRPSDNKIHNIDDVVTFSSAVKMISVCVQNANEDIAHILRKVKDLSIADKTGYKIDTWTDDEIITSTTLAVGSVVPSWSDGTRYGCRGVRLNVKEGDKVLLDTYSPALYGLIFTDENRVVKALYDDRRFDGVWTAPCDGYCYIQDVLYRDCYHYSSAHGHLAYMAHDARNKLKGKQDWFNQYSPTLRAKLPKTYTTTFTGNDGSAWQPKLDLYSPCSKIFQVFAFKARINIDMSDEHNARLNARMASSNYIALPSWYLRDTEVGEERWLPCLHNFGTNQINISNLIIWFGELLNGHTYSIDVLDVYHHDFDDYKQARMLYDGIWNGTIIPDGDLVGKDTDILRNAISLQSISDLGYNILDYGATLPIDEDGYKYAKEIYDRYKDNPPTGNIRALFANDEKLVYFPNIDLSNATAIGGNTSASLFMNCYNLKVIPPLNLTGNLACGYTIQGCRSLKRIESLGDVKVTGGAANFMYSCYALEYVGKIDTSECTSFWGLLGNAYSLKRIEELDLGKVSQWGSSGFVSWPSNAPVLEYMLIKNIFRLPSQTTHIFSGAPKWGINSEENPDARQSLVDSLLTYSYDRVNDPDNLGTAGTTCTITLSANTYAQLTASEIESITAKGYTLTHP